MADSAVIILIIVFERLLGVTSAKGISVHRITFRYLTEQQNVALDHPTGQFT
ncbi:MULTISPECIES: hypothetical protein [Pectobacterium]|jgi:hypothetical protein|uniref:Uncharacterized protein n=2 Tax=Pectobacterium TaxID=122277 RepID=A0AAW3T0B3_9GAMM|nr:MULTISPECIES: hypothetical protein [Pectobacterium]ACT11373.1 hypothetical protein PC1_0314 [Pectobacterium carotovorum subsp. carotovorum PC1]MBA0205389.1 hypothetical protein [Pectobacterium aroidearum]MBA5205423.1 hypothetical protein [Pectobacterium aroidearum]MBA5238108.1 hypothetical protein [Pectobacterium aroidearum]MBA5601968.1 hypothetical protein [Pectobacterium aroidearum]